MASRSPMVVCVGSAVMDHVFAIPQMPDRPIKVFATDFHEVGGGPAANAAVTVARLGGRAKLWTRVGADTVGEAILTELGDCGVDVGDARRIAGARSGLSAVMVDPAGERLIVNFGDPKLDRDAGWLPLEHLEDAAAVLADMRWPEGAARALSAARDRGIPGVLDADMTPEDAGAEPFFAASHLVFSAPALARFAGTEDIAAGLTEAADRTGAWVGVTVGAGGAYWRDGGATHHLPAFQVDVVDTLAAGDVFHGAFALALAEDCSPAAANRFAAAAAALKCARFGGRSGIPARAAVDAMLKETVP